MAIWTRKRDRTSDFRKTSLAGKKSANSSAPTENPGKSSFDQERGKLFAVNFREHRKQVGEARIADPHLLAVQDVVLAVRRKHGTGEELRASDPQVASDKAYAPIVSPAASRGRYFFFCSPVPK